MAVVICVCHLVILNRDDSDHLLSHHHRHCQPALSMSPARNQTELLKSFLNVAGYQQWLPSANNLLSQTTPEFAGGRAIRLAIDRVRRKRNVLRLVIVQRDIKIAIVHDLSDHRVNQFGNLCRLDQLAQLLANLAERRQFLVALKQLRLGSLALCDIARYALNADRFPFPIDQPATELERQLLSGLGDDFGLINARVVLTFDFARKILAHDAQVVGRDYASEVHAECLCLSVSSQSLSGLI